MNVWDILILPAVPRLVYLAVRAMRSGKSRCSCGCEACGKKCECKKTQKTDRS